MTSTQATTSKPTTWWERTKKKLDPTRGIFSRQYSKWQAERFLKSGGRKMGTRHGTEICVVTMKGAKSGITRHIPLMYVPYCEGVILVASRGGTDKHPTWYYNLVAHPNIQVQVKERSLSLYAKRATPEEKASLWPICVEHYAEYADYQASTSRDIPIFICLPRDAE